MFDPADSPALLRSAPEEAGPTGTPTELHCDVAEVDAARAAARAPVTTESLCRHLGHELRTPLHAILGNVELLVDGSAGPLSADARACLGDVQNAGRQLLRQVDLVLLLVQAEATSGPAAREEVDLLGRMRHALRAHAATSGIEPPTGRLVLRGDPFWLDTWVSALVEALVAGPERSAAGRVGIERVPAPSPHEVGLRIACSGGETRPPSPVAAMLIDAIVRLHGGRILPKAGPGLGLAWPASRLVTWQEE